MSCTHFCDVYYFGGVATRTQRQEVKVAERGEKARERHCNRSPQELILARSIFKNPARFGALERRERLNSRARTRIVPPDFRAN